MYENISRKMGDKGGKDLTVSVTPIFLCLNIYLICSFFSIDTTEA